MSKSFDRFCRMCVAKIFDWGEGGKPHLTCDDRNIRKEGLFVEQRFRRMEDQMPVSVLAHNQDFAKRRGLEAKVEKYSKNV